jgi:membrane protease YdiL (CAAX protease family)
LIQGLKVILYFVATVLLGAAIAPLLFWTGRYWSSRIHALQFLAETDFQRFFDRSIVIAAFALLGPALYWIRPDRLRHLGLRPNPRRWRHLAGGGLVATSFLFLVGLGLVLSGAVELKQAIPWSSLTRVFFSAIVVALIEEALFRGALLGLVRQSLASIPAVIVVSLIFAVVHFLKPPADQASGVTWHSGFDLLPKLFRQFSEPSLVLGGAVSLFVLGLLLAAVTVRTSSLWLGIGLHAGFVFGKMSFNKLTLRRVDLSPWFGQDLTAGIGSVLILLSVWFVVWLIFLRDQPGAPPMDNAR